MEFPSRKGAESAPSNELKGSFRAYGRKTFTQRDPDTFTCVNTGGFHVNLWKVGQEPSVASIPVAGRANRLLLSDACV